MRNWSRPARGVYCRSDRVHGRRRTMSRANGRMVHASRHLRHRVEWPEGVPTRRGTCASKPIGRSWELLHEVVRTKQTFLQTKRQPHGTVGVLAEMDSRGRGRARGTTKHQRRSSLHPLHHVHNPERTSHLRGGGGGCNAVDADGGRDGPWLSRSMPRHRGTPRAHFKRLLWGVHVSKGSWTSGRIPHTSVTSLHPCLRKVEQEAVSASVAAV